MPNTDPMPAGDDFRKPGEDEDEEKERDDKASGPPDGSVRMVEGDDFRPPRDLEEMPSGDDFRRGSQDDDMP